MVRLAIATILFYALHSLLASLTVKQWARRKMGLARSYRAFYTVIALGTSYLVWQAYRNSGATEPLCEATTGFRIPGLVAMAMGALLAGAAILRAGALGFIGLLPEKDSGLLRSGLHGYMRHPIYSGVILVALGWIAVSPSPATLLTVAITFLYLPLGIALEEQKLVAHFGEAYLQYRREVPALWPRCGRKMG